MHKLNLCAVAVPPVLQVLLPRWQGCTLGGAPPTSGWRRLPEVHTHPAAGCTAMTQRSEAAATGGTVYRCQPQRLRRRRTGLPAGRWVPAASL